jgi:hypothetical protein
MKFACLLKGWNGPSASMARKYRRCTGHSAPALQLPGLGHDGREQRPWARTRRFVPTQSHLAAAGAWRGRARGCRAPSGTTSLAPCPVPRSSGTVNYFLCARAARAGPPPPRLVGGQAPALKHRPLGPALHAARSDLGTPGQGRLHGII